MSLDSVQEIPGGSSFKSLANTYTNQESSSPPPPSPSSALILKNGYPAPKHPLHDINSKVEVSIGNIKLVEVHSSSPDSKSSNTFSRGDSGCSSNCSSFSNLSLGKGSQLSDRKVTLIEVDSRNSYQELEEVIDNAASRASILHKVHSAQTARELKSVQKKLEKTVDDFDLIDHLAKAIEATGRFDKFEISLLEEVFNHPKNLHLIGEWYHRLCQLAKIEDPKEKAKLKKELLKEIQKLIKKNINLSKILKYQFNKSKNKFKEASPLKKVKIIAWDHCLGIPLAPVELLGRFGWTLAHGQKRKSFCKKAKIFFTEKPYARHVVRDAFAKGVVRVGTSLLVSSTIAALAFGEMFSFGAATPLLIAGGSLLGIGTAGAIGEGVYCHKSSSTIFAGVLLSMVKGTEEGTALGISVPALVELAGLLQEGFGGGSSNYDPKLSKNVVKGAILGEEASDVLLETCERIEEEYQVPETFKDEIKVKYISVV